MTFRGYRNKGHQTKTQNLLQGVVITMRGCFGHYRRRSETITDVQRLGLAARASTRKRKPKITLPDRPFDWEPSQ